MHITRVNPSTLNKVISGGGQNFDIPNDWISAAYGSGWPIAPVNAPKDTGVPRSIDYPISVNATLTPRTGYGLMPFASLLEAYENVTECKIPVSLLARELITFVPRLVDSSGNEAPKDHPYHWMTEYPDRKTPWGIWLQRFIKSAEVYAAPAIYMHERGGTIDAMHYIDGSTLFLIVDEYGNTPAPEPITDYVKRMAAIGVKKSTMPSFGNLINGTPTTIQDFVQIITRMQQRGEVLPSSVPAYTQVIKGTPFSWWSSDQVWYMPQSRRMNSPYGESFIEQAWSWIMLIVNILSFELGHYRTGNMPEGFVTLPKDIYPTSDRILLGEQIYNHRMFSNPATERNRIRMFPDGTKYIQTKKPDFPTSLYTQAWKNILHTIGIPPSEFGDVPGAGLGGKGFKEGGVSDLSRMTLNPRRQFLQAPFNYVLERDGVDDVKFSLDYPLEEIDPNSQKKSIFDGMIHGVFTLNDALSQLGQNYVEGSMDENGKPVLSHIANKHLIVAGANVFIYEDLQVNETGMAIPVNAPQNVSNGEPVDPETAVVGDGHTPDDKKTLMTAIQNIMDGGKLDSKTYSIPSAPKKVEKVDITDHDGAMVALYMPSDVAANLRTIADTIGLPESARQELAENMHLTLAFLPDKDKVDTTRILGCIQSVALSQDIQLNGKIQGFGVFNGQDGEHVLFAMLDCPVLPELRQRLIDNLKAANIEYGNDHGFVPHITLAYFTDEWQVPEGFMVPDMSVVIDGISLAVGKRIVTITLNMGDTRLGKVVMSSELLKHCGVCPEDDAYFGAPISREFKFEFPGDNHANEVEIVAMAPPGLMPKPALWKPEGGEESILQDYVGGKQYVREEAAYLLDRSLGFQLVPVSYVTEANGEKGAAVYYVMGNKSTSHDVHQFAPEWLEKAAVIDYIMSQLDRGPHHNYVAHPDDQTRMILIDNGLSFPANTELDCKSFFCSAMVNIPLSTEVLESVSKTKNDMALWSDVRVLIGSEPVKKAQACCQRLLDNGMITESSYASASSDNSDLSS